MVHGPGGQGPEQPALLKINDPDGSMAGQGPWAQHGRNRAPATGRLERRDPGKGQGTAGERL